MQIEEIELTDAQARELHRMTNRAKEMYEDRHGGRAVTDKLMHLSGGLNDIREGEKDALRLGIGMKGDTRKELIGILEREQDMEQRKANQDWGLDGRKLRALENGLEAMKNPELKDSGEI